MARAGGLPILADAPFALVSDVLRRVWLDDGGRWFGEALGRCPGFVAPALSRILPEIGLSGRDVEDRFATARLFAAIESTLAALSSLRPLALVLEDLHCSDPSSRGFIERHVVGGRGVPIVGSLRTGESAEADAWLTRVRREAALVLNLAPLTHKETREQLRLLIGPRLRRGDVERVHAQGRGVPLFTEELARSMTADTEPEPLADLLARQLDHLSPSARSVLLVAALADRPLPPQVVADATSMGRAELTDARRELVARHLLADPYAATDVTVRHPLTAAAVRAGLVPGEAVPTHRRLAAVLAAMAHPSPAEVAEHWRGAGDPREELRWRVAAGRAACDGLSRDEEAVHWERALALWPADGPAPADAGITRCELLLELVHSAIGSGRTEQARSWVEEALALAPASPGHDHARALRRASQALAQVDPETSVRLADEAIAVLDALDDRDSLVRAMGDKSGALRGAGRNDEADLVIDRMLEISARLDDPALHRDALVERAWHDIVLGRTAHGLRAAREARTILVEGNPFSDVWLGTYHTDLLLMLCAPADDVADAADPGLAAVRDAGIDSFVLSTMLLCNVAEARLHAGATGAASRLVRPRTKDEPRQATRFLHLTRAWVEVVHGDLEAADRRLEAIAALDFGVSAHRQAVVTVQALCDLWRGLPAQALDRIGDGIAGETATSVVALHRVAAVPRRPRGGRRRRGRPRPPCRPRRSTLGLAAPVVHRPARPGGSPRRRPCDPQHVARRARPAPRRRAAAALDRGGRAVGPRRSPARGGVLPLARGRARAARGPRHARPPAAASCPRAGARARAAPRRGRPVPRGGAGPSLLAHARAFGPGAPGDRPRARLSPRLSVPRGAATCW